MNENIDLCEILKDCPYGTKLYCTLCGEVRFDSIDNSEFPINLVFGKNKEISLTKEGWYWTDANDAECLLFPSKDQREWSKFKKPKFDPKTLQPFDKVLVRSENIFNWNCSLFSNIDDQCENYPFGCLGLYYKFCIPYNDDTKHLVATTEEAPEFYRYWED